MTVYSEFCKGGCGRILTLEQVRTDHKCDWCRKNDHRQAQEKNMVPRMPQMDTGPANTGSGR